MKQFIRTNPIFLPTVQPPDPVDGLEQGRACRSCRAEARLPGAHKAPRDRRGCEGC
jgi:hypothetical protein